MHRNYRPPATGIAPILLLLLFAAAAAAAGGRVVIVAASGKSRVGDYAGVMIGRRLEDVVAPELFPGGGIVVGAGGGSVGYGSFDPSKPACPRDGGCAGKKPGEPYTRPCTYQNQCERP
uniref:Uncharacterized protein n=1 Tax=Leersia perrieri TaxID=77586 RepID=A0A0D9Y0M2_9ORYZ